MTQLLSLTWSDRGQTRRWPCTALLLHHLFALYFLKLVGHTVGHLLTEKCIGCRACMTDFHGSFPLGFNCNLLPPGTSPESKDCSQVTSVHDPTLLPSLTQQVPSRWALEIKTYSRSNCLLRSPRRKQPLLRKANKEPLSITAWDTDSYLSGRIKPRPQAHRNLGIAFSRGNSHLPLLRPITYSPGVEGWTGLVKNGNRWSPRTQKLDMGLAENRDNLS